MPKIGEVKGWSELGYKSIGSKYIWHACEDCGNERWVRLVKNRPYSLHCRPCCLRKLYSRIGTDSPSWKGGRKSNSGYIMAYLSPDDFFYPMATKNHYVLEHRLVMAKHLGRNLHPWEIVHHKHTKYPAGSVEDKRDNRIENLQLVTDDRHKQITILENRIHSLEQRVLQLEIENIYLRQFR